MFLGASVAVAYAIRWMGELWLARDVSCQTKSALRLRRVVAQLKLRFLLCVGRLGFRQLLRQDGRSQADGRPNIFVLSTYYSS